MALRVSEWNCCGEAESPRPRRAVPPPLRRRQQRHLEGREPSRLSVVGEATRRDGALLTAQEHHERDGGEEKRHLHEQVIAIEVAHQQARAVPKGVQQDSGGETEEKVADGPGSRGATRGEPQHNAGDRREHDVGEWRQHAAEKEDLTHADYVSCAERHTEVLDVLGEGESDRDHRAVDETVDRPIELPAEHPEQQKHTEALSRLLHYRRLDDGGDEYRRETLVTRHPRHHLGEEREDKGDGHRGRRTPEQREQQRRFRLRLPAVDPADGGEHDHQRNEGHHGRNDDRHGSDGEDEVGGDRERDRAEQREAQHGEHDDGVDPARRRGGRDRAGCRRLRRESERMPVSRFLSLRDRLPYLHAAAAMSSPVSQPKSTRVDR